MEWHQYLMAPLSKVLVNPAQHNDDVHDKKLKAQPQIKQGENKEVKFMRPDKDINIVMSNKDISISIWMKTPLNLKRCDQMYFISL